MREKQFENNIKKYLKSKNIWYFKVHGNGMQRSGIPDILACINSVFFGIEVKGEGGKTSALQDWNIKKIRESGGIAGVYYPKDFELLKKQIEEVLNEIKSF